MFPCRVLRTFSRHVHVGMLCCCCFLFHHCHVSSVQRYLLLLTSERNSCRVVWNGRICVWDVVSCLFFGWGLWLALACLQKVCQSVQDFSLSRKMMKNFDREKVAKQMRNGGWKRKIVLNLRSAITVKIVKEYVWGAYLRILACETLCLKAPNTMFGILKQHVWHCQTCSLTILTLVFIACEVYISR